ncbi:hypothetical protein [Specibacter sp. NPDC078709]|uniref:hypothetical protein n=1 Tax=Specibacter sp. NPDC078709 TaxID=3154364 RepID=UPI00343FC520
MAAPEGDGVLPRENDVLWVSLRDLFQPVHQRGRVLGEFLLGQAAHRAAAPTGDTVRGDEMGAPCMLMTGPQCYRELWG